jgi:hypothetical protein
MSTELAVERTSHASSCSNGSPTMVDEKLAHGAKRVSMCVVAVSEPGVQRIIYEVQQVHA